MATLLHHNLSNAAKAMPDQEAYRCEGKSLTYAQLNEKASKLASLLRSLDVKKGDRVAIRLPVCLESAIAVYGILKAGAAFVPIDPNVPSKRVCDLLKIGAISVLITQKLSDALVDLLKGNDFLLSAVIGVQKHVDTPFQCYSWADLDGCPTGPDAEIDERDPAYVIFTSGSTGTPKGIIHSHFSGDSYARLSIATYQVTANDRIGNISPLHFDMSTFGYLASVKAMATTILVPPAYGKLPASLSQLMQDERISIWYSVPFALIQLLERGSLDQRDLSALRWVKFGGEPFLPAYLQQLSIRWPQARFSNVYGPAEVNQCTYFHIPKTYDFEQPVPIGRIWEDTEALVINKDDTVVEPGDQGELLIHSVTMMLRYWDGAEQDTHTFFTFPDSNKRYYRTGDLVKVNEQGEYLFLGRKDRQVKIRGYRIELDEIEHVAAACEQVEEAAAFCIEVDSIATIAVAVTVSDTSLTLGELRKWLTKQLPTYAMPGKICIRDSMPRTTSGKIDRNALKLQATEK